MLTEESYQFAWGIYLLATIGTLLLVRGWLLTRLSPAKMVTVLLMLAALLLTPALPESGMTTFAPGLVVAGFDLLTHGPEAVMRTLRPLLIMQAFAVAMGLVFFVLQRFIFSRNK